MPRPTAIDTAYHDSPERYDRTRGLSEEILRAVVDALLEHLPSHSKAILDLGAGSGRFAIPLAARGRYVVALDLSVEMLGHLRSKVSGRAALRLAAVRGDAMHLPFREAAFMAEFSVHTLHLVADLEQALREIARTLQRGGTFALGYIEHDPHSPVGWVLRKWRQALAERGHDLSKPMWREHSQIIEGLIRLFGFPYSIIAAQWEAHLSLEKALRGASERLFTPYWGLSDEEHAAVVKTLYQAARHDFGDLSIPRRDTRRFVWHFFKKPATFVSTSY